MSKHTPGPWHSCDHRVGRQDGARIADTWSSAVPRDEQAANARLIAAAPELLEALKTVTAAIAGAQPLDPDEWQACCAAIAKAE